MILLKQKRKTYIPPSIEVTVYEEEIMGGGVTASVNGPNQPGPDEWSKSSTFFDDPEDDSVDDWGNDFDYDSYRSEMLW